MHGTVMDEWKQIESEDFDKFFDKYPGYLSSNSGPQISPKKLKQIGDKIRKVVEGDKR